MSDGHVVGTLPETSFDDAETFFKNFLEGQGFGSELIWVFREDVFIVSGGIMFVHTPIPSRNRDRAKKCFELGKERGLGIKFHAFATLNGVLCAFVSMPKDDLDAQYKLMGNLRLKCSHTMPMAEAKADSSFFLWHIRQLIAKHPRVMRADQEIPLRRTLLPPGY